MTDVEHVLAGERVLLLSERALFRPAASTLYIADAHWGKDAAFSARGIPLPDGTLADDLDRLSAALERTGAQRLVILGDLLHARVGVTPAVIERVNRWRAQHPLELLLVRGNHDRHAELPASWDIRAVDAPFEEPPFALAHLPAPHPGAYTLAGHLHPAYEVRGRGGQRAAVPCFWWGAQVGVLPAFGGFTGFAVIHAQDGDRVHVVVGGSVLRAR